MSAYTKITKEQFYSYGGFANPKLFRKQDGDGWSYWEMAT
jgi:hypothetical protein